MPEAGLPGGIIADYGKYIQSFWEWADNGILKSVFYKLHSEAETYEISIDASIVQAHQHSAGASTEIHADVDAYGYPVHCMISEGQHNDIRYAVPVLENINKIFRHVTRYAKLASIYLTFIYLVSILIWLK